ncbi:hypothetical protein EIP91_009811 [Steccherinum ochraceum]|uniref:BHLH domain-containing protein n=1 Tax=Steccherinum ochraceum TaxID=92696 RepID=A0A4V2MX56_9APHY|nr:hypothetical protein EIP91_009811 [Steccherinum ochraceum]
MAAVVVKDASEYARSINPPRRAKRPRHDELDGPPTASVALAQAPHQQQPQQSRPPPPHILPKDTVRYRSDKPQDGESSDEGEDEYDPSTSAPTPKRRGRKPGTMSRSARESQRKLNHSRIEKARRTKINETLATLSNLVSNAEKEKQARGLLPAAPEPVQTKGKATQGEKEFKLDVLVKAVAYVEELMMRVKTLESQQCSHCALGAPDAASVGKRKRDVVEQDAELDVSVAGDADDVYIGDDERAEDMDDEDDEHRARPPSSRYSSAHPTPSPRLPPIASWLPHPYVDPSCIPMMSERDVPSAGGPQSSHLPSPPMSGSFRPAAYSLQTLPNLTLPGPARPMARGEHSSSAAAGPSKETASQPKPISVSRRMSHPPPPCSQRVAASPSVSPSWTPEDETAASMLLQMSSSPRSASSSSTSSMAITSLKLPQAAAEPPHQQRRHRLSVSSSPLHMQVQTPSSMLGM